MCDINRVSQEKDAILADIDKTTAISGAVLLSVEEKIQKIEEEARENSRKLAFLL